MRQRQQVELGEASIGKTVTGTVIDYKLDQTGKVITLILQEIDGDSLAIVDQLLPNRCANGHSLNTAKNVNITPEGYIRCLACVRTNKNRRRRALLRDNAKGSPTTS